MRRKRGRGCRTEQSCDAIEGIFFCDPWQATDKCIETTERSALEGGDVHTEGLTYSRETVEKTEG